MSVVDGFHLGPYLGRVDSRFVFYGIVNAAVQLPDIAWELSRPGTIVKRVEEHRFLQAPQATKFLTGLADRPDPLELLSCRSAASGAR